MADAGIVRNRLKIDAAVTNARAFLAVQKEFGSFDKYIWQFVGASPEGQPPGRPSPHRRPNAGIRRMSRDLKKRGFRFVGSTICYAFMQATGMVDDHVQSCFCVEVPGSEVPRVPEFGFRGARFRFRGAGVLGFRSGQWSRFRTLGTEPKNLVTPER
jgi:hypothetical protein